MRCSRPFSRFKYLVRLFIVGYFVCVSAQAVAPGSRQSPITGNQAFADYSQQKPGVFRKITVADLPEPHATKSVDNGPDEAARPANAWPQAPAGFKVELYAAGLDYPRLLRVAPNGDIFLAESHSGEIKVFRGVTRDGKAERNCLLSIRKNPAMDLRWQHGFRRSLSLSKWRPQSPWRQPENCRPAGWRTAARRRPLDPGYRIFQRRQEDVCVGWLTLEQRRL